MPVFSWTNLRPPVGQTATRERVWLTKQTDRDHSGSVVARMWSTLRGGGLHSHWIGTWSAVSLVGTFATPLLLHRPVLLLLLAPRTLAVALAAQQLSLLELVLLGTVRLSLADPSYFILGRRFSQMPARVPRRCGPMRRLVLWLFSLIERSPALAATVIFLRPSGRYLAVAGAKGMPATHACIAAVTGTVAYLMVADIGMGAVW